MKQPVESTVKRVIVNQLLSGDTQTDRHTRTNGVTTISLSHIHVLGITNRVTTISLPRIHVLEIINALTVQIPRHNFTKQKKKKKKITDG